MSDIGMVKYSMSELTAGVELDSKTCIGDLRDSLTESVKRDKRLQLNMHRGIYVPWCSDKRDDTIFICHKDVNAEAVREDLYRSDFGYTFSEVDPKIWTSIDGDVWLGAWTADRTDPEGIETADGVVRSLCTSLGSKDRTSRSVLITTDDTLSRLRGTDGSRVVLKKLKRAHEKTIYALVQKGNESL